MLIRHQPSGATVRKVQPAPAKRAREQASAGLEVVASWLKETGDLIRRMLRGRNLMTAGLAALVVLSSMGVVYSVRWNRELYQQLDELEQTRAALDNEWVQLLLEESSLGAPGRIEMLATEKLNMVKPGTEDIQLVRRAP